MNGIRIKGTGRSVPAKVVTNQDMARIVDTNEEWIVTRTGIRHRHHLSGEETFSSMAAEAGRAALENAGVTPEEIGLCIVATLSPETLVPSAACLVQRDLGLPDDIPCFDLNAACTGFLYALHVAECMLNASPRKYALILGAEGLSRLLNWEDRGTCILFGDGAGAVVAESGPDFPSICAELGSHGNDQLLHASGAATGVPSQIAMEGTKVFKFAVQAVPYCIDRVLHRTGLAIEDVDFFVFHQANERIIDAAMKRYHIPPEKSYTNVDEYGNTSAASIPLVLSELHDLGKVHSGSRVLVVGFGGGLTWGGALVEFA